MEPSNVIRLSDFRQANIQETIDDISAEAFMFLRKAAVDNKLPVKALLIEHLSDIVRVLKSIDGPEQAQEILSAIEAHVINT